MKTSDLLEFYSTNSLAWEALNYESGAILNLHYGLIHKGMSTLIDTAREKLPYINGENNPRKYTLCKCGDVAFADASEDTEEVGKAVEFASLGDDKVVCGLHTIHGRDKTCRTVTGFKGYAFNSKPFHNQMRRIAQGTKIYSINTKNFEEVYVGIPSKEEQAKITKLLALIDERISTQIGLIEDLKTLKSAISHKLFERKPINRKRLDTFFSKGKAGGTPRSTVKTYYDGNIPFLSINDMSLQGKYVDSTEKMISDAGLKNSSAWIVPPFSLIMSMYASVGLVAINTKEMATSQAMFAMVLTDKSLLDYLYYYLCYFKDRCIYKLLETGTQSNINADVVRGIMIPDYGEKQNQFAATVLNVIDEKISNESMVLEKMYQQKQYLLQMMFI